MARKKKYPKSQLHGIIVSIFADNPFKAYNNKQIAHKLGIKDKAGKNMIYTILTELLADGYLQEVKKGKFVLHADKLATLANKKKYITGTVEMKKTGKAYIVSDEGGEDIYIAPNNTHHALHGDHVKVLLFPKRKGHKTEGQIVEILERKKTQYVGILEVSKNFGFVVPDSPFMPVDIFVPKSKLKKGKNGDKVLVNITDWPEHSNNPFGEVIEVLGKPGDNDVEMKSILADFDFPLSFPDKVLREAEKIRTTISKEEIARRKDFRKVWTITIDPVDAKDFDDALSLRKLKNGLWEVGVHIADVTHYVRPDTVLDAEAYKRATSVYLVDRVIPMLPEKLSNGVCSLRPDEDKLTFSAVFTMNDKAEVVSQWFGKTVIRSNRRFAYEEVQKIIETEQGEFVENILKLNQLASIMREIRFKNGAINFNTPEIRFKLDEKGKPIETYVKESKEANHLVEEFMLLANKSVATFVGKPKNNKTPKTFVYRVHDEPNPEKLNTFTQFLNRLGYSLEIQSRDALARSFNALFDRIKGKGEENMIETIAIRTMSKAYYSTENIGHYGLAFPYYTHFTSPIRRYPDMMVHRLLEKYLEGKKSVNKETCEEKCEHASEMERKAADAERASVKYKQVEFLIDKVGKTFDGLISGVSKWGIFVELVESKSEGLIRFNDMKDDYYYLDEDNYQIIGKRYGQKLRLGDKVRVLVKNVDLERRQLDFEMVE
ncbi:ribonuclease R [Candidatus Sulfidibacterium hydrothermale]|uniref:ribonuclease R n=1 Tax=Candidatus Sulfidibacterium hydrothermale TaxID=2875962 RepID=UPI001F0ADB6A|nr:ribonuclease R [Candidatus Sulfidibacterium hydrothermale]UBM62640.1 ribonuclease R [Candidatus Sulfidibacterium hydrothermale]